MVYLRKWGHGRVLALSQVQLSVQVIHSMFNTWSIGGWPVEGEPSVASSEEKVWRFAAELYRDLALVTLTSVDFVADPDSPKDLKPKLGHPGPATRALARPELKDVVSRAVLEVAEAIRPVRQEPELVSVPIPSRSETRQQNALRT